ncbi:Histone H2A deubiquitinase MYSM1 [Hondaea fermentalgiana]|uniref:Histone H2A deubiquitinase MYSM1 n=1 Tax=Hondaea fermentalgiana TaxID=2315210 RepID=A0A2R5GKQ4_9STRA|nr:Histone H2A deubiquitinase MYSM1 [Hondaea fermentalgiana]|eukprot:GBG28454.1 Histone H2A deubiquitinase MYSM1 [Hondaea fermentalgiana]
MAMDDASSALIARLLQEDNEYAMNAMAGFMDSSESEEDDGAYVGGRRKRKKKGGKRGQGGKRRTLDEDYEQANVSDVADDEEDDYLSDDSAGAKPRRRGRGRKQSSASSSKKDGERKRAAPRRWTSTEETRFEEALELYGRDWKKCAAHLDSGRKPRDIASHAQKYFIKLYKDDKPLPDKVRESGEGYTLSGKPLDPNSAAARAYGVHGSRGQRAYRTEVANAKRSAAAEKRRSDSVSSQQKSNVTETGKQQAKVIAADTTTAHNGNTEKENQASQYHATVPAAVNSAAVCASTGPEHQHSSASSHFYEHSREQLASSPVLEFGSNEADMGMHVHGSSLHGDHTSAAAAVTAASSSRAAGAAGSGGSVGVSSPSAAYDQADRDMDAAFAAESSAGHGHPTFDDDDDQGALGLATDSVAAPLHTSGDSLNRDDEPRAPSPQQVEHEEHPHRYEEQSSNQAEASPDCPATGRSGRGSSNSSRSGAQPDISEPDEASDPADVPEQGDESNDGIHYNVEGLPEGFDIMDETADLSSLSARQRNDVLLARMKAKGIKLRQKVDGSGPRRRDYQNNDNNDDDDGDGNESGCENDAERTGGKLGSGPSAAERRKLRAQRKKQEAWEKQQAKQQQVYGEDGRTEYSRNRSRRRTATRFIQAPSEALEFVPFSQYVGPPASGPRSQPFRVTVHSSVYATVDLHAHLSTSEVMGFLAGTFDAAKLTIEIKGAYPGRSTLDGATECEMDPMTEVALRDTIQKDGLTVVGWYHSHPTFEPVPSQCDVANQANYQALFRDGPSNLEPFLGLIMSPYDMRLPQSNRSQFSWFYVESPTLTKTAKRVEADLVCDEALPPEARERMRTLVKEKDQSSSAAVDFSKTWRSLPGQAPCTFAEKVRRSLAFWLPPLVHGLVSDEARRLTSSSSPAALTSSASSPEPASSSSSSSSSSSALDPEQSEARPEALIEGTPQVPKEVAPQVPTEATPQVLAEITPQGAPPHSSSAEVKPATGDPTTVTDAQGLVRRLPARAAARAKAKAAAEAKAKLETETETKTETDPAQLDVALPKSVGRNDVAPATTPPAELRPQSAADALLDDILGGLVS